MSKFADQLTLKLRYLLRAYFVKDFFISYSTHDTRWADWIAWELDAMGFSTMMQKCDFEPGANFALEMQAALKSCRKLILLLSNSSLASKFVAAEWAAFFAKDPSSEKRLIIPIRIEPCNPDGLLGQIIYIDLFDCDKNAAQTLLREAIGLGNIPNLIRPLFPGTTPGVTSMPGPQFPDNDEHNLSDPQSEMLRSFFRSSTATTYPSIRKRAAGRAFVLNHLKDFVDSQVERANQASIVCVDVDGMTGINTKYGVDVGDAIMERLFIFAEEMKRRSIVGRMGDDTFFSILINNNLNETKKEAARIIRRVAKANWTSLAFELYVTCSAGYAEFGEQEHPFDTLVRAIEAQKEARRMGGNRSVHASIVDPVTRIDPPKINLAHRDNTPLRKRWFGRFPCS